LISSAVALTIRIEAGESTEDITVASTGGLAGRLVRSWTALDGMIRLRAERTAEPYGALKLNLRIENHSLSERSWPARHHLCHLKQAITAVDHRDHSPLRWPQEAPRQPRCQRGH
jgi:hypothetical protein